MFEILFFGAFAEFLYPFDYKRIDREFRKNLFEPIENQRILFDNPLQSPEKI